MVPPSKVGANLTLARGRRNILFGAMSFAAPEAVVNQEAKLYIGNLSYSTTDASLKDHFGKYGEVVEAMVMLERDSGRSRGFGFVSFKEIAEAEAAVTGTDG